MFLRKGSSESIDEFKEKLNVALGYVKPASKPSPTK